MHLTKNHIFNIVFWAVIILFMGVKSIEHTIDVHDQGVGVAIHEYRMQAQARMSHINTAEYTMQLRTPGLSLAFEMMDTIGNTMDPYQYIQLNDRLTNHIDATINSYNLTDKDYSVLLQHQQSVKQESLIFHSHAEAFNRLIQRFPYSLLSDGYPLIEVQTVGGIDGVIVER